jgi:glycosyltransferase involved in cell wall biosynthesis
MRILVLAPQEFFVERGTPIAVRLLSEFLDTHFEEIDLLTYPGGSTISFTHVRHLRTPAIPFLGRIGPGFSIKKMVMNLFFFAKALMLVRSRRYDMIHAIEDAAIIALFIRSVFKTPYIYDMDSSMAQQVVEKMSFARFLSPLLMRGERALIETSSAVVAVCPSLAKTASSCGHSRVRTITDISLLEFFDAPKNVSDLRREFSFEGFLTLYVGNLEKYQGVELLLRATAEACNRHPQIHCVIIGGTAEHIRQYQTLSESLGIAPNVHFAGARPIAHLRGYVDQADVVTSPRIKGRNTPMKVYSYMDSGIPMVATAIESHTQILDSSCCYLAEPEPAAFSQALCSVIEAPEKARTVALAAKRRYEENHSHASFREKFTQLYGTLQREMEHRTGTADIAAHRSRTSSVIQKGEQV